MRISSTTRTLFQFIGVWLLGIAFYGCSSPTPTRRIVTPKQFSFQPDSSIAAKRAKDFMIRGSVLQMQELYAEAILEFQLALRYDSSEAILYAIAKNYAQLNKNDLALEYGRAAQRKDSSSIPILELLADVLERLDETDEVVDIYETLVTLEPSNLEYTFALAQLYQYRDPQRSINLYQQILRVEDDEATMWFLAQVYRKNRDYDNYTKTLERLYSINSDIRVANVLMQGYINYGLFTKGIELLDRLEFSAQDDEYYELHSSLTEALNEQSDSLLVHCTSLPASLQRMSTRPCEEWTFYFANATLAYRLKDTALSESMFRKALTYADSTSELPIRIGGFYMQYSNFTAAIRLLQTTAHLYPSELRIPLFLGIAYSNLNLHQEAIPHLRNVLQIDSLNFDAWTQLGIAYDHLHYSDSSDSAYEHALQINATSPLVNNNYAYSLSVRQTKLPQALTMAQKAVQAQPHNPSYLDTFAWVHFQLGDYSTAVEYLEKAVNTSEPSATILEHLGDTYSKLGNELKAIEAYSNALKKSPDRTSIKERLRKLSK